MDIRTFSQTYWYVWLLISILVVILILLNVVGVSQYFKKRRQYLSDLNRNIPLKERLKDREQIESIVSSIETRENVRPKSVSFLSKSRSFVTNSTIVPSSYIENSKSSVETTNFNLEIFRRQALQEHNRTRAMHQMLPLKLSDALNIYAQHWADHCAQTTTIKSSESNWRLNCNGKSLGEHVVSTKSNKIFDGRDFTRMIITEMDENDEESCLLNRKCVDVGFGCAQYSLTDDSKHWIGVAHYSHYYL